MWLGLAALVLVLIAMRGVAVEELWRTSMRQYFRAEGGYADRRSMQSLLIVAIVLAGCALTGAIIYRWARLLRGRRNYARMIAVLAGLAMVLLVSLRLASLHSIDALLYGAPKLNWIIDIGASFAAMAAAVGYVRLVRARP